LFGNVLIRLRTGDVIPNANIVCLTQKSIGTCQRLFASRRGCEISSIAEILSVILIQVSSGFKLKRVVAESSWMQLLPIPARLMPQEERETDSRVEG
jgi:hypothetical protein